MEYFYDHQTDMLSITIGDFASYDSSEEVAPGVTVHCDAQRRALGVEIREAKAVVGVRELQSFEPGLITNEELARLMRGSVHGLAVLRVLNGG